MQERFLHSALDAQVYQLEQLLPVLPVQMLPQFPAEPLDLSSHVRTLRLPEEPLVQRPHIVIHEYRLLSATHNTVRHGEYPGILTTVQKELSFAWFEGLGAILFTAAQILRLLTSDIFFANQEIPFPICSLYARMLQCK